MKLNILEKDLEDYIYNLSQTREGRDKMLKDGIDIPCPLYRQVRIGDSGIADLIGFCLEPKDLNVWDTDNIFVEVMELKKGIINLNTLLQACRYARCLMNSLAEDFSGHTFTPRITLIGDNINYSKEFFAVMSLMNNVRLFCYEVKSQDTIKFHWDWADEDLSAMGDKALHHILNEEMKRYG